MPTPVMVRRATPTDEQATTALMERVDMVAPFEPESILLAFAGETLVGYARVEIVEGKPFIRPIAVDAMARGLGAGRTLIDAWSEVHPALYLVSRGPVRAFYEKLGFVPISWEGIPEEFYAECEGCPGREECQPAAMVREAPRD